MRLLGGGRVEAGNQGQLDGGDVESFGRDRDGESRRLPDEDLLPIELGFGGELLGAREGWNEREQIGRASCRERV